MRFMHNSHSTHASRETTSSRFEPPHPICCHRRGEERYGGGIPAIAKPACSEQGSAAGARYVSGCPSGPLSPWVRTHDARPENPPGAGGLATEDGAARCSKSV